MEYLFLWLHFFHLTMFGAPSQFLVDFLFCINIFTALRITALEQRSLTLLVTAHPGIVHEPIVLLDSRGVKVRTVSEHRRSSCGEPQRDNTASAALDGWFAITSGGMCSPSSSRTLNEISRLNAHVNLQHARD
jgi:hypothetical protein